jgi:hypothetical protein
MPRYVEFTAGGVRVDLNRYLKSEHGKEALRRIGEQSKRFEMKTAKSNYEFGDMKRNDLLKFCLDPPHDTEFNELKKAAKELAEYTINLKTSLDKF